MLYLPAIEAKHLKRNTNLLHNLINTNIYFWLKFGLANTIDDYLRLNICAACKEFLTLDAY